MRLTLEKKDLIAILEKHFGQPITPSSIDFEDEPFGVSIGGLSVDQFTAACRTLPTESNVNTPEKEVSTQEKPEVTTDSADEVYNMDQLMRANASLALGATPTPAPKNAVLGENESFEPFELDSDDLQGRGRYGQ